MANCPFPIPASFVLLEEEDGVQYWFNRDAPVRLIINPEAPAERLGAPRLELEDCDEHGRGVDDVYRNIAEGETWDDLVANALANRQNRRPEWLRAIFAPPKEG